jgi:hypothetical protein
MSKVSLDKVKQMIKQLSPEDRRKIIPYLAEFPDTGLQSYDLRDELEVLQKYGKSLSGPDNDPDYYLVNLVFVRNLVSVEMLDTEVLRAVFFPDNFIEAYPKSKRGTPLMSDSLKRRLFTEEKREALRAERVAQGIQDSDAEFEEEIKKCCDSAAEIWMTEKAKRIAEQISLHLPGMVGDMFCAAIKGQTFADTLKLKEELGGTGKKLSTKQFKKIVLDSHWREYKPHIGVTHGGDRRTKPAWRGNEILKQYAQRVNDRRLLTECIKNMYEDCLGEDGWTQDLHQDSTFQRLSQDVPDETIAWAIRHVASEDIIPQREREPLLVACEMARQELALPEQDIETLRSYYTEGKKLIQQNRSKPSK